MAINITRHNLVLAPDPSRVLLRSFVPGGPHRMSAIAGRILAIPEESVGGLLEQVTAEFATRHQGLRGLFLERFEQVSEFLPTGAAPTEDRRLLIGAYFLTEYSVESAALFNPSITPHPDQSGMAPGALRFVLSLRATGEGHISSITFRTGVIHADGRIEIATPAGLLIEPRQIPNPLYARGLFVRKLSEMGVVGRFTERVTNHLTGAFTLRELRAAIDRELYKDGHAEGLLHEDLHAAAGIWALASSNYEVQFQPEQDLSERILFPATASQANGIEDARFVRFTDEAGGSLYFATFTAFDGKSVMPELIETADFLRFRFLTLNGPAALNKGMALFPRKIKGRFAMLGRQDNESISIMFSDNVHFWNEHTEILKPVFPWELIQVGNCGSPIETDAGWLVLSHGVGPMRRYCIGAFLLDRDDPTKVLGRLREPLLQPNEHEREGYVPNVVYSCGALIHDGILILPYGLSDHATGFATVPVCDLLAAMESE